MTRMDCRISVDKTITEYLFTVVSDKEGIVNGMMFS